MNRKIAWIVAPLASLSLLTACGSTTDSVTQANIPSISAPSGKTLTPSLLLALLPAAVQQSGLTRQQFCASIQYLSDSVLTQGFMAGYNQAASASPDISIDPNIVAPTIRTWCSDAA